MSKRHHDKKRSRLTRLAFQVWRNLQRGYWFAALCMFAFSMVIRAQPTAPRLEPPQVQAPTGWVELNSSFHSNTVLMLDASSDLTNWQSVGTLHDALRRYPDFGAADHPYRFYRLLAEARTATNDWKNQILFPAEPFRS